MYQGVEQVHQAVRLLASRNAMIHQRLFEAAKKLSEALSQPNNWPRDFRRKALRIEKKLKAKGSLAKTLSAMDVAVAERIADEMLDLVLASGCAPQLRLDASPHRGVPRRRSRRPLTMRH